MDDNIRVTEFLSYRHNEIKVICKFMTLLELFTEQVTSKAKELEEQYLLEKEYNSNDLSNEKRHTDFTERT